MAVYRMTKAGVIALSETLFCEMKERGAPVGVSVLCPSFVRSRLNDAERNRPASLSNPPEECLRRLEEKGLLRFFEEQNEKAMSPRQFAGLVFKAIEEQTLYAQTHPEQRGNIERRMEDILKGRNPVVPGRSYGEKKSDTPVI